MSDMQQEASIGMPEQPVMPQENDLEDTATDAGVGSQTIEQRRAAAILTCVHALPENNDLRKEYRRLVETLPAMTLTNGLGQVLAYLESRAARDRGETGAAARSDATGRVIHDLTHLLVNVRGLYAEQGPYVDQNGFLLQCVINGNREHLRRATDEALAVLNWWTKFVRAFLPKPDGES